jgi:hypothetical protein
MKVPSRPELPQGSVFGDSFSMTVLAGHRTGLFHGVTCSAHPVGSILAETRDMPSPDLFPVTLLAIAFIVALVCPMRKCDSVLQLENFRAILGESGCSQEKYCWG